jgi:hypothetical protein
MLFEFRFQFKVLRKFFLGVYCTVYSREWKLPVLFVEGSCNSPYNWGMELKDDQIVTSRKAILPLSFKARRVAVV